MTHPTTFLGYCFQRSGFGRTSWPMAIVVFLFIALWAILCAVNYGKGDGWWVAGAFSAAIFIGMVANTYGNWKQDLKRWNKPPVNNHYVDVCEGCDPVRMKDGKPIEDFVKWYAAVTGLSRPEARDKVYFMPLEEYHYTRDRFNAYRDAFPHKA